MVFKSMLLGGLKKDDYKELAKRLNEIGWNRMNDQCRHEVYHIAVHLTSKRSCPFSIFLIS